MKMSKLILSVIMISAIILSCVSCTVTPSGTQTAPATSATATPSASAGGDETAIGTTPTAATATAETNKESDLYVKKEYTSLGIESNAELSRLAAAESMVLLKNENGCLPLSKDNVVSLFGEGQINMLKGGTGSGNVNCAYIVNPLEGLRNKAKDGKCSVNETLAAQYGISPTMTATSGIVNSAAKVSDTAIVFITRNSGEGGNRSTGSFILSDAEKTLLGNVCTADFENICVVLNICGVMSVSFLDDYPEIDSLLVAWQPGMEGGNAIADVLCGDVNPSGKLADTFADNLNDYSSSRTFIAGTQISEYTEDIYVGYRYFETFDPNYEKVRYEFGYGLSYTTFEIADVKTECDGINVKVTATVKNTGNVAGREVVQVYYSAPQAVLGNPAKELAGFVKTGTIKPGESEKIALSFSVNDMASYDDTGKITKSAYILEKGDYNIYVGNSVKDAGKQGVRYTYTVKENIIAEQLEQKLAPVKLTSRLLANGKYETLTKNWDGIVLQAVNLISSDDYYESNMPEISIIAGKTGAGIGLTSNYTITYRLQAPEAGDYTVFVYAANSSGNTVDEAFSVKLNSDEEVPLSLAATETAYKATFTSGAKLSFKKGLNTIVIRNKGIKSTDIISFVAIVEDGKSISDVEMPVFVEQPMSFGTKTVESFKDVYNDRTKLEAFVNGLTVNELVWLLYGHGGSVPSGTGVIGGLKSLDIAGAETADGPAGLRLGTYQTAWPIETALACSFDDNLIYNIGLAVGTEANTAGVDYWLAPGLNIHRNPLCGRNFEYYSEDTFVTGTMASALTTGVQSKNVGVVIKHFACNNTEVNRKTNDSRVSERALREIYLKGFEITIKNSQPWGIMSSYNYINGVYTAQSSELLTDILRGEWGYQGFVTTDWENFSTHYKETIAGNDVVNPVGYGRPEQVIAAYKAGFITIEEIRLSATRILEAILKTNAMERLTNPVSFTLEEGTTCHIKAVEFSDKADRITTENCEDTDGGLNPKFTEPNTYLIYAVNAKDAGKYSFSFRLASPNGAGAFDLYVDDAKVGSYKVSKNTGGWQAWQTFSDVIEAEISEGNHEIMIKFTAEQININWFEIKSAS